METWVDLFVNLILTKVGASRSKSTQTESQVDLSFQLASSFESVWPGLYMYFNGEKIFSFLFNYSLRFSGSIFRNGLTSESS